MLIAESGVVLMGLLFVLGLIAAIVLGAYALVSLLFGLVRGAWRMLAGAPTDDDPARLSPPNRRRPRQYRRACPHDGCGHLNRPEARFCARCGAQLGAPQPVDAYV